MPGIKTIVVTLVIAVAAIALVMRVAAVRKIVVGG